MSTATLERPRARHASPVEITTPAICPLCGKKHQAGKTPALVCAARMAELAAAEVRTPESTSTSSAEAVTVTADDVALVLSSRYGAIVACPWGGVMAARMPYPSLDVVVTHADLLQWWASCGGDDDLTAAALSTDLAWLAQDDLAVAA